MGNVTFESLKAIDNGFKLYFTSYLRKDFVEKSVVVTIKKDFIISGIYLSSYNFGSVEWINGKGLIEARKWETDEQAEAHGYLTRRYTTRISNGYAPEGDAENLLIPDVLNTIDNRKIAEILRSVMKVKKSKKKIIPETFGFR
ncbi:MAG TPA: hypothetical protein PKG60_14820 [Spirochaetota bacterium]|nr:hypothetical protein [Spirochaetota bacterium]HPS87932.1 hypothetical protein [Spirochaetota bacterium]